MICIIFPFLHKSLLMMKRTQSSVFFIEKIGCLCWIQIVWCKVGIFLIEQQKITRNMKKMAHIQTWKQLGKKSSVQNSKSPTSFREISQSREKRLGMVQGRMGDRLQNKVKGSNKLFSELLKSRSPSPANKLSLTKNSQMSTLECSTSFHNNQSKCHGVVTGLQFRGLKQRINHTYKRKEPQKADSKNSSQPHKQKYKYVTQKSIIRHKSKENIFPTQLDCRPSEIEESVIRSREGKLLFDMSPTL